MLVGKPVAVREQGLGLNSACFFPFLSMACVYTVFGIQQALGSVSHYLLLLFPTGLCGPLALFLAWGACLPNLPPGTFVPRQA